VVDKDNHNHLRDCLKYLVLSLPAQTPLEVRLAAMVKWHPESLTGEPRKAEDGPHLVRLCQLNLQTLVLV